MPSIRELRDQRQRESFTGRQAELNTFRRLLTADTADYAILHIYGVGGIGKSSLLRQFRRIAQELGYPAAIVDMQVHFSVDEILRSIREQLAQEHERAFAGFDKALDMFNDVKSKLQGAVGSLASGVVSGLREGVPLGIGALAVDTIGEEQMKAWLYRRRSGIGGNVGPAWPADRAPGARPSTAARTRSGPALGPPVAYSSRL